MKRFFAGALALVYAFAASATTLNPVQLLNPTGSSSGQAIVSTGASTAPIWGGVGVNGIGAIAANTVLANATGSSASPTAFTMPSCSATGNALNWTSATGFTCATGYAPLASPSFTGTTTDANLIVSGTASVTGTFTPSQTAGIVGTTTNNNANAGSIGEYVTANTVTTSASSGVSLNATSISLTAGDWDISGIVQFNPAGSTTTSLIVAGISTTSATFATAAAGINNDQSLFVSFGAGLGGNLYVPTTRISIASTTPVYLVTQANFAVSTMTVSGFLRARRVR